MSLPATATLFTHGPAGCAACHWVRRSLERGGVVVRDVDVTTDREAQAELARLTDAEMPVPTLLLADGRVALWPAPATLDALFGADVRPASS